MNYRSVSYGICILMLILLIPAAAFSINNVSKLHTGNNHGKDNKMSKKICQVYPGIWRITLGEPESKTPTTVFSFKPEVESLKNLSHVESCPISADDITGTKTDRGYEVSIPLTDNEQLYGLGLQLLSFNQRGKKRTMRVNSDPSADTGDSHAPVPFYVTTEGYGVYIDTLRYLTIYGGCAIKRKSNNDNASSKNTSVDVSDAAELYRLNAKHSDNDVVIEIPYAKGIDIYLFAGPNMREAVQRYNLFSGGGCIPPLWGLGVWYRCKSNYNSDMVLNLAKSFRETDIPCDVIGLENEWQSHTYSCTHVANDKLFPDLKGMTDQLIKMDYHLTAWTHAFTDPSSPIYKAMNPHSGNYQVWGGLVPDWADPKARKIYADFIEKEHIAKGIEGYKMDECDNSDFISYPWSFPEISKFPSGLNGDQMHSAYGRLYQQTTQSVYDKLNQRTYGQVRSSHAFAAPEPYVLYSDLYDHNSFIRGVVTSGFSGLLWCPEVRNAFTSEELIRRVETVVFSPQALVNAWFIQNPPWMQWDTNKNNAGISDEDHEKVTEICKSFLELRMKFIPYLYSAFYDYHLTGMPPFRALVMDDPSDPNLWNYDTAYMMGDRILVAPVVSGVKERDLYLPRGAWRDFWTNDKYEGGKSYHFNVPLDRILVFVKDNSLLPLAEPVECTSDPSLMKLNVSVYGTGIQGINLYEDNTHTYDYKSGKYNKLELRWSETEGKVITNRKGNTTAPQYVIKSVDIHK